MTKHTLSSLDDLVVNFDQALRTVFGKPLATERANPADNLEDVALSDEEKRLSIGLMRVNHCGEVAAQALYQGQALTAKMTDIRETMTRCAREENDHLVWCEQRVTELGGRVSMLNPLWYLGSFVIGATAGAAGDKYSLGFVIETEKQVVAHLEEHLQQLPAHDQKSRAIVAQMSEDEGHHAAIALKAGGVTLPIPIQWMMRQTAKVMTTTAFWI
jgi:ubiquinone biosynthesis monooxygenase Coq7